MSQSYQELTLSEVLRDPMILSLAHADGVSTAEFSHMLHTAAKRLGGRATETALRAKAARFEEDETRSVPFPGAMMGAASSAGNCCRFL